MHKQMYNQSKIIVTISPITPLLIKSGMESADPSLPDMSFVRTCRPDHGDTVYIPGSSFKGVLRSYSEKILRSLGMPCCNPMSNETWNEKNPDGSCNQRKAPENTEKNAGAKIYKHHSCHACRIYGSTHMSSRVRLTDGFPTGECKTEKRSGVAIDRVLGSVAVGPFDYETVVSGEFKCEIFLNNFQLWQIGLIGLTLRDLDEGYVQMGFAKSRGLGRVAAKLHSIEISYLKKLSVSGRIWGVGMDDGLRGEYGFLEDDFVTMDIEPKRNGFRTTYQWKDASLFESIVAEDSPCWQAFLRQGDNQ